MERLEQTLGKTLIDHKEEKREVGVRESSLYEGLRLIEDKAYQGPTSIRYWM